MTHNFDVRGTSRTDGAEQHAGPSRMGSFASGKKSPPIGILKPKKAYNVCECES